MVQGKRRRVARLRGKGESWWIGRVAGGKDRSVLKYNHSIVRETGIKRTFLSIFGEGDSVFFALRFSFLTTNGISVDSLKDSSFPKSWIHAHIVSITIARTLGSSPAIAGDDA